METKQLFLLKSFFVVRFQKLWNRTRVKTLISIHKKNESFFRLNKNFYNDLEIRKINYKICVRKLLTIKTKKKCLYSIQQI